MYNWDIYKADDGVSNMGEEKKSMFKRPGTNRGTSRKSGPRGSGSGMRSKTHSEEANHG